MRITVCVLRFSSNDTSVLQPCFFLPQTNLAPLTWWTVFIQVPLWTTETPLSPDSALQEHAAWRWCWRGTMLSHLFFKK